MINLAPVLHILVMVLLTLQSNVIASHFRVNTINILEQMFSFAVHSHPTFYCLQKQWTTQKEKTDIITIVNLVQITHKKYIKLEKIFSLHPEKIFEQMSTQGGHMSWNSWKSWKSPGFFLTWKNPWNRFRFPNFPGNFLQFQEILEFHCNCSVYVCIKL